MLVISHNISILPHELTFFSGMAVQRTVCREPLNTADVTTANVTKANSTANASTANVSAADVNTANVLGLGLRASVRVWVRLKGRGMG